MKSVNLNRKCHHCDLLRLPSSEIDFMKRESFSSSFRSITIGQYFFVLNITIYSTTFTLFDPPEIVIHISYMRDKSIF